MSWSWLEKRGTKFKWRSFKHWSRGSPGQWFPETKYLRVSAIFVSVTSGISPNLNYRSASPIKCRIIGLFCIRKSFYKISSACLFVWNYFLSLHSLMFYDLYIAVQFNVCKSTAIWFKRRNKSRPGSWDCRIRWLHFSRRVRPTYNESPGYDIKFSDGEAPVQEFGEMWNTTSSLLIPSSLGVIEPVRIPSMAHIEISNCVPTKD